MKAIRADALTENVNNPYVDRLLRAYREEKQKVTANHQAVLYELNIQYLTKLSTMVKSLMQNGSMVEAKAVQAELDAVKLMLPKERPLSVVQKPDKPKEEHLTFNRHRYLLLPEPMTWKDAIQAAVKKGGHVLYINDAEELEAVLSYVGTRSERIWLGAEIIETRTGTQKRWSWKAPHYTGNVDFSIMKSGKPRFSATNNRLFLYARGYSSSGSHGKSGSCRESDLRHVLIERDG